MWEKGLSAQPKWTITGWISTVNKRQEVFFKCSHVADNERSNLGVVLAQVLEHLEATRASRVFLDRQGFDSSWSPTLTPTPY